LLDTTSIKKNWFYLKIVSFIFQKKKDWIVIPHKNVNWLKFEEMKKISIRYFEKKSSPLCWLKKENGEILKIFLVWW